MTSNSISTSTARFYLGLAGIFLFSFIINIYQALIVGNPHQHFYSDMQGYMQRAWKFASGVELDPFDSFFPSGLSYFYWGVFKVFDYRTGLDNIILIQTILSTLSVILVVLTAKLLYKSLIPAFIVGILTALFLPFILLNSFFVSEIPFIFLSLLSQYIFLKLLNKKKTSVWYLPLGLLLGFLCLIRGQGLCYLATAVLILLFKNIKNAILLIAPACLILLTQSYINHNISKGEHSSISANSSYNLYLGQSRRAAIGCLDPKTEYYYVFHQNNSYFDRRLFPIKNVYKSILDSTSFRKLTLELWLENPYRQVIRSLRSVVELFSINPTWPNRDIVNMRSFESNFRLGFYLLILLPALFFAFTSIQSNILRVEIISLLLPTIFLAAMAFLSMGQPRYFIPFQYNFFIIFTPVVVFITSYLKEEKLNSFQKSSIFYFLSFLIFIGLATIFINNQYSKFQAPKIEDSSASYFGIKDIAEKRGLVGLHGSDLGKNINIISNNSDEFNISLSGFSRNLIWERAISWSVKSVKGIRVPRITTSFPKGTTTHIALYMTDGDSKWRTSKIKSGDQLRIADDLHQGRWIIFPVSKRERTLGSKSFDFHKLTGANITISKIIFLGKNPI